MNVSEAVETRRAVRAFLDKPVDRAVIGRILQTAQRAPSGGNVQPWSAKVLTGEPLQRLFAEVGKVVPQGRAGMKETLGGKGANLAEMTRLGVPVPPGFTISTEVCAAYNRAGGKIPPAVRKEALAARALSDIQVAWWRPCVCVCLRLVCVTRYCVCVCVCVYSGYVCPDECLSGCTDL